MQLAGSLMRSVALSIALAALLGACGSSSKPVARSADDGRGSYRVGKPYVIEGVTYYPAENWDYNETGTASWYGPGFHGKSTANGENYDQNAISAAHKTLPLPSIVRVTNLDNGRTAVVRVNDRGPFVPGRIIDMSQAGARELGFDLIGTAKVRVELMRRESEIVKQVALNGGGRDEQLAAIKPGRGGGTQIAAAAPSAPIAGDVVVQQLPAPPPANVPPAANAPSIPAYVPPPQAAALQPPNAPGTLQPPPSPAPAAAPLIRPQPVAPLASPGAERIYVQAGAFSQIENAQRLSGQLSRLGSTHVMPVVVSGRELYRVRIGPLQSREQGDTLLTQLMQEGHRDAKLVVE